MMICACPHDLGNLHLLAVQLGFAVFTHTQIASNLHRVSDPETTKLPTIRMGNSWPWRTSAMMTWCESCWGTSPGNRKMFPLAGPIYERGSGWENEYGMGMFQKIFKRKNYRSSLSLLTSQEQYACNCSLQRIHWFQIKWATWREPGMVLLYFLDALDQFVFLGFAMR